MILILILYPSFFYAQTYNPQAALEYADYWWDGRNTNNWTKAPSNFDIVWGNPYNNYNTLGGDCANFVSQCLRAGGLILDEGADGFGTGVDNRKCIKTVDNFIAHLKYKDVRFYTAYLSHGKSNSFQMSVGDVAFIRNEDNTSRHSLFCSYVQSKTPYYATHSSDQWRRPRTYYRNMPYSIYFRLNPYPEHCYDCVKNYDETGIDCGGSCPPCAHAPDRIVISTPTNNLPSEVRAIEKITAGNAAVKVLNGQNVSFITTGAIELLPGFEVEAGGNFDTQIKNRIHDVTAECGDYCYKEYFPNSLTRRRDYLCAHDVVNADKVEYEIHRIMPQKFIHSEVIHVTTEGIIPLWDLVTGEDYFPEVAHYTAKVWIYPCMGGRISHTVRFVVVDGYRLLNEELEETETSTPFLPPTSDDIMPSNESTPPIFSILPNPNPGTFQLEANFPLTHIAHLKITNLLGATVYESQKVTSNTIQLPNAAMGTHFVVVMLKDGNVLMQKMVVQ